MPLSTDLFDYILPEAAIAQTPAARREQSRLLVVHRQEHRIEHRSFADLPEYLAAGDTLIRNNAAVLPARLLAHRPTGGAVECLLLRPEGDPARNEWRCLVRPGRKLPVGATFARADAFAATVIGRSEDGGALVRFSTSGNEPIADVAVRVGEVPLPPYITRTGAPGERPIDLDRYQTTYADTSKRVAVAAPTAGLHFTAELDAALAARGVATRSVTLHVGLGTFKPIATEHVEDHAIHRELYEMPVATQETLRQPSGRRIAVGTTSVRSIEDYLARQPVAPASPGPWIAESATYLYPPCTFRGVDALITNFHQPRSTLLCLVSAFLAPGATEGIAWLRELYAEALRREYRFLSYGDAMLIL